MKSGSDGVVGRPVRVSVVDESELVVAGVEGMLAAQAGRAVLVDPPEADVVLCDPVGRPLDTEAYLVEVATRTPARVVVYTWRFDPGHVRRAVAAGAHGFVSKAAGADELVRALELVHRGEAVPPPAPSSQDLLSTREAEVLALICRGRSNLEIAAELFVSVNSVKTYIRQIYAKIGVARRSQAVAWGLERGY